MKYERLTKYSEINKDYITPYCDNFICDGVCRDCDYEQIIINRLAELEDKIENGTLVEISYKVGDMVWFINEFVLFMGCPDIAIRCGKISRVIADISNEITYMYNVNVESTRTTAGYETYTAASRDIFLTKAEAEKRLEELRGER